MRMPKTMFFFFYEVVWNDRTLVFGVGPEFMSSVPYLSA